MSKARENASDHVAIGFSSVSDWMKSNEDFLDQSQREVKQNQCNSGLLSTLYRKLYYYWIYWHIKIQLSIRFFENLYISFSILSILQHFQAPKRSINSLIRNTVILFRRFYTGFFSFLIIHIFLYSRHLSTWNCIDILRRNYVLVLHGSWRVNEICVISHVEISADWALLVFFFTYSCKVRWVLNSHFFARITEEMNCDQKCIEMTNVEDLIFSTYFEYIPMSGS